MGMVFTGKNFLSRDMKAIGKNLKKELGGKENLDISS
jgi:hypothetical protein